MAKQDRHVYGPRAIGALVPGITRPAFRARAPAASQLMADWTEIVGPALSAVTAPRRLSAGTLTLACAGPVALELQHLSNQVIERINAHSGRVLVQRLRFVQEAVAAPSARPVARPAPAAPVAVPGIAPGPLQDALAALGGSIVHAATGGGGRGRRRAKTDPA